MLSIAKIPCFGTFFTGFICFLMLKGKMHLFATYSGSRIEFLEYNEDKQSVKVIISGKYSILEVTAVNSGGGVIKAPVKGLMKREITESISAAADILLKDKSNNVIYRGSAEKTGMELCGDIAGQLCSRS